MVRLKPEATWRLIMDAIEELCCKNSRGRTWNRPAAVHDRGPVASTGRRASHLSQTARRRLAFERQSPRQRSCPRETVTHAKNFNESSRGVKKLQTQTFLVE